MRKPQSLSRRSYADSAARPKQALPRKLCACSYRGPEDMCGCEEAPRARAHLELDVPVGDALSVAEVQRHDQLLEEPTRQVLGQAPAVAEGLQQQASGRFGRAHWGRTGVTDLPGLQITLNRPFVEVQQGTEAISQAVTPASLSLLHGQGRVQVVHVRGPLSSSPCQR